MTYRGDVHNGMVLQEASACLPEGVEVLVEAVLTAPANPLELALQVYAGLSDETIREIEEAALDRHDF